MDSYNSLVMQILIDIDYYLFSLINNLPRTSFLNVFFSFFSGIGTFGLVWLVIAIVFVIWEETRNKRELLSLLTGLLLSYLIVEVIFKNLVKRMRPEFVLPAIVVGANSNSYSFPSGHTTIAFACAYILAAGHRKYRLVFYLLAALISFSRVYLGSHYPIDVVAGILVGLLIGWSSVKIIKSYNKII